MAEEDKNEESAETPAPAEKAPKAEAKAPAAEKAPAADAKAPKADAKAPAAEKAAATDAKPADGKPAADGEAAADAPAEDDGKQKRVSLDEEELPKVKKIKGSKNITNGVAHIRSTFNNTSVSITDLQGNVVSWSTAGRAGFKGARKSTAYAATVVAQDAARSAQSHGMQEVEVRVQGPGAGRESAIRAIQSAGITISIIRDVTPVPHNGCRPKKRRRV